MDYITYASLIEDADLEELDGILNAARADSTITQIQYEKLQRAVDYRHIDECY